MISILLCGNTHVFTTPPVFGFVLLICFLLFYFCFVCLCLVSCILDVASVAGVSIRFSLMVIYESRGVSYSLLFSIGDILTSHDILYEVTWGFIPLWWYIDISRHLIWGHMRVHTSLVIHWHLTTSCMGSHQGSYLQPTNHLWTY